MQKETGWVSKVSGAVLLMALKQGTCEGEVATTRDSSSTTQYSAAPLPVVLVGMSKASPTSKGCTTNSKMTELNKFMMELLKEKEKATRMEDMVSHTLVRSTCTPHANLCTSCFLTRYSAQAHVWNKEES